VNGPDWTQIILAIAVIGLLVALAVIGSVLVATLICWGNLAQQRWLRGAAAMATMRARLAEAGDPSPEERQRLAEEELTRYLKDSGLKLSPEHIGVLVSAARYELPPPQ
jgi:hypothetical protein